MSTDKVILPGAGRKHILTTLAFLVVAATVIGFFWRGLSHPADKNIPSALLGKTAQDFQVRWLQGQEHLGHIADAKGFSLADFKGRPLILNFWASWCYSCREEARDFEAFWQLYKDKGIAVVGIAIQDSPEAALAFAKTYGKTYMLGLDSEDGRAAIDYGVTGVPETFIIDRNGKVLHKEAGPMSTQMLADFADKLLAP
ncbi:MAG: TlpA disulfide reductase family protein [Proteobacteria bacterium]|nr:TlpA disulfide reductase family protein [Pseudomonadota bacterium]